MRELKALEIEYKSKFRKKLQWYKKDQDNPLLKCIIDDFDSIILDICEEFEELNNRSCDTCRNKNDFNMCNSCSRNKYYRDLYCERTN